MIPHPSQVRSEKPSLAPEQTFEVLVRFAALMWRSGNTAIRTRECIGLMAPKLGFDDVVLSLSLEAVTVGACRARVWTTATRSPGPPAVNTRRIAELEQLAKTVGPGDGARDLESKLAETSPGGRCTRLHRLPERSRWRARVSPSSTAPGPSK